jgi:hypothetical protein
LYRSAPPSPSADESIESAVCNYNNAVQQDNVDISALDFEPVALDPTLGLDSYTQPVALDPSMLHSPFDLLGEALDFPACWNEYTFEEHHQV